jgi:hypothetical protein
MDERRTSERTRQEQEFSKQGASSRKTGQVPQAGTRRARMTSRPGQVDGRGGPGDRTNLSGQGGPDKSNWNQDTNGGREEPES